jgi:hypothetical protein
MGRGYQGNVQGSLEPIHLTEHIRMRLTFGKNTGKSYNSI